ncbi:DUF6470 family protein [Neobacillus sp. YX16]|uniref:DUF6470 family protein n=1 Tax=Neobacillus sp. YX16 TaxID=3047874 RepID=UPI0024C2E7D0|nr:DUF6470 family protein [Neobacillus sp. YX16]WHZ05400.1 DUF6470 family protein [Neobacillus sp. YX16]
MQVPQIRLQQTYAQIGLRITQPIQELQQEPARLSIKQTPATMKVTRTPSKLDINQDQARNEINMKMPDVFSRDNAEASRQKGLENIAEIVLEGNQLAAIETKTDALAAIAVNKSLPEPDDYNIAFIPSYGSVQIDYTPTQLHIEWEKGGADIHATPHEITHHYTPGKTEVYLRQMNQLQIDIVGGSINTQS